MSRPGIAPQEPSSTRGGRRALFFILAVVVTATAISFWPRQPKNVQTSRAPLPTVANSTSPPSKAPPDMVWIPGGEFSMGTDDPTEMICGGPDAMPDARPIHRVYVDGFCMDATEVTNEEFEQ